MKNKLFLIIAAIFATTAVMLGITFTILAQSSELPIVKLEDSLLNVSNSYATEITQTSATLNLTFSSKYISEYELYMGTSPDNLTKVCEDVVGAITKTLASSVDGLVPFTRYYYYFAVSTDTEKVITKTLSFITPDGYYNGSAGGANDENVTYGIDVSFWNRSVDFVKVKEQGYDFVILRAGSTKGKDTYFEEHYEQAKAAGLKVGVYFYSYAMSVEEVAADADMFLSQICGKVFELPVYFDFENSAQASGLDKMTKTEMCFEFCDKIASAGYYPGIYANRNWFNNLLNTESLSAVWELWIAAWPLSGQPDGDYSEGYGIWQYYDKGSVDGVPGESDMNICYKDYASIIEQRNTVKYEFLNDDSTLLTTYYMMEGAKIYEPDLIPVKESDDDYEYVFSNWSGLTDSTFASARGGTFIAEYNKIEHKYGDWSASSSVTHSRECSECGYVQTVVTEQTICGDNCMWSLSDGTLTIIGSGDMYDGESNADFGWYDYIDTITSVVIYDGITSVGDYAFSGLKNLTSVTLPYSLLNVGKGAFADCPSLGSVSLPAQIISLGADAFGGTTKLAKISGYADSLAYRYAKTNSIKFVESELTLVDNGSLSSAVDWHFYSNGELVISGIGKCEASSYGFGQYSAKIVKVSIGAGITAIGKGAFEEYSRLECVYFAGTNPIEVKSKAFYGCTMLWEINLPYGSTFAGDSFKLTPVIQ